jgi:hypothetical protein
MAIRGGGGLGHKRGCRFAESSARVPLEKLDLQSALKSRDRVAYRRLSAF